jgi:uncharacterized BrkB/YihY/UPF0761 family membrane protein/DNA-binding IscR family transcriptional regulator
VANDFQEPPSRFQRLWDQTIGFFHETGIGRMDDAKQSRLYRFAHLWLLVGKSFIRNRCPVRASALAYTTLLALIPLLAVGLSIGTKMLQDSETQNKDEMIRTFVRQVAPMLDVEVKAGGEQKESPLDTVVNSINKFVENANAGTVGITGTIALVFVAIGLLRTIEATFNDIWGVTQGRGWVASIIQYWATITLGPVVLLLVLGLSTGPYFAKTKRILGLSLLTGRDIQKPRVLMGKLLGQETNQHAVAESLYHLLLKDETFQRASERFTADPSDWKSLRKALAESINTVLEGRQFYDATNFAGVTLTPETQRLLATNPKGHDLDLLNRRLLDDAFREEIQPKSWEWVGSFGFYLLPFIVLSLAFGGFYQLMPNTRVQPTAALVGGIVGGSLWLLNNKLSVLYVSKVASYGQIYGSLGLIPLFLIGMYFSWLILLFGAQVAYAYQNRQSYLQEKQAEGVNQSGREFVALRVMTFIAQQFQSGAKPPGVNELASTLGVPTRLVSQVLQSLLHTKLLVEVLDREIRYTPARPLDQITAHDILHALRSGQGMELDTREDAHRARLRRHFSSINTAERETASALTLELMANDAQAGQTNKHQ